MPFRVTVDPLPSALENSKEAAKLGAKCDSSPTSTQYWPAIEAGVCPPLGRLPLTLSAGGAVNSGTGQWTITGDHVQIFAGPSGGAPLAPGKFPIGKIVFAEGQSKGGATLTWTLTGDGDEGGELIKNPAKTSLLVAEPKPLITLLPIVIGVTGANAKLRLSADMAFDKGTLTIVSGGDCFQLLLVDNPIIPPRDFTSTTELDVKAIKGSTLEGVEFQWALQGVEGPVSAKLTVVQGTLKIFDKLDREIVAKQRIVHKNKSRAKVIVECQPGDWDGQLRLGSGGTKVKLYANPTGPDGETATAVFKASATPKTFYVQGVETSASVWDTTLKLDLVGLADGVDEAKITVIETVLDVSNPRDLAAAAVAPNAKVQDFGTGVSVLSAPPSEPLGEVTLYRQGSQFRAPRALVRVKMTPKETPCKLILKPVQAGDKTTLFPEANERHRQGEAASVSATQNLEIAAGGIATAENARVVARNAGRYGADGYVLWADGTDITITGTPTIVQLDVEGVDDDCCKVKFNVVWAKLTVEVRRSDGKSFTGGVQVTIVDVATADKATKVSIQQTISKPTLTNPAVGTYNVPIGDYRVQVVPQGLQEKDFRITLTTPAQLPLAAVGAPVSAKFMLDPPYTKIQFIGYKVKTGAYKGLDSPAALSLTQQGNAQTQAKAFAMASVLDAVDSSIDPLAPQLKIDLKGRSFDQVKADNPLNGRVKTIAAIDLDKAYAKELKSVENNIARREGAQTDIEKRCDVMIEAVVKAFASTTSAADPKVLKVFMAPEFYFRGQQGAYAVESLHQILDRLSVETSKAKYQDWLFVLGSAIGYRERPEELYREVTAVPTAAKTKVSVYCHDILAGSLADAGWDFLVGVTRYAITDKQDNFNPPWHNFTFTVTGVPTFATGAANLGVWNAAKVGITTASKTAIGRFTFNKAHAALSIQAGWILKRQGVRLTVTNAAKIDNSNWRIEVRLKPRTTVSTGTGHITQRRLARDHSGTFTLEHTVVTADYPAGNMASKCMLTKADCTVNNIPVFKFRVAGSVPGNYDVADSQMAVAPNPPPSAPPRWFHFDPPDPTPVWTAGDALSLSPDRCEVRANVANKEVILRIDFGTGPYPNHGWKFEQGPTRGIVKQITDLGGNWREVVLRVPVNDALDPTAAIKFTTSSRSVEIFNVCFVQKGGAGAPASSDGSALKARMVEKETISSVDFAGPEYGTLDFYDELHYLIDFYDSQLKAAARQGARKDIDESANPLLANKPGAVKTFKSKWGDERDAEDHTQIISERSASGLGGGSLFEIDGLSFGLEVCLDHDVKRLKKSGVGPVKVQLIPACGMSIKDNSKHMMANGFIFNVCGGSVHSVAQKAPAEAILGADNAFAATVPEYNQLFAAAGSITVHRPRTLIPPLK